MSDTPYDIDAAAHALWMRVSIGDAGESEISDALLTAHAAACKESIDLLRRFNYHDAALLLTKGCGEARVGR